MAKSFYSWGSRGAGWGQSDILVVDWDNPISNEDVVFSIYQNFVSCWNFSF